MKRVRIELPYYSTGDDLKRHIEQSASVGEALANYAADLEDAAETLLFLKSMVAGHDVKVFVKEVDFIEIEAADDIIDELECSGLV